QALLRPGAGARRRARLGRRDALRAARPLQLVDDLDAHPLHPGRAPEGGPAGPRLQPGAEVAEAQLRRAARVRQGRTPRAAGGAGLMAPDSRFAFSIDLPIRSDWANVDLLRTSVQNCFTAVFSEVDGCQALAMVTGELLENAIKYGDWSG